MTTLNDIKATIENMIRNEAGAAIEVTFTGGGEFTISGKPADVEKAKPWFSKSELLDSVHDAELDETFNYYR